MSIMPFFINSNICTDNENINSFNTVMNVIGGNTGNSYITYSLIKAIFGKYKKVPDIKSVYSYDFSKSEKEIDEINNSCSHVFLILQDQIRIEESYGLKLPYENIINFIKKINKPLIIAGLGANSFNGFDIEFHKKLNSDLIYFLQFLSDNCNQIGIRGHFTEEVLSKIGVTNTKVIGCPSYFETGPDRIINKKQKIRTKDILLSSIIPNKNLLKNNYQIMQDFSDQKIIKAIYFNEFKDKFNRTEFKKIKEEKYRIFPNIEDWKNFISQFKFTIGTRLHGSIISMNAGVPAICCNNDTRTKEMSEFLKIPNVNLSKKTNIIELYEKTDFEETNKQYPILYENYKSFMENNGIQICPTPGRYCNALNQPSLKINKDTYKYILKNELTEENHFLKIKLLTLFNLL